MNIKEQILNQADIITVNSKESLKNIKKVAIDEAWKLLQIATAGIVQIIENIAKDLSGSEKKQIALNYLNSFYDNVFIAIDIPFIPAVIEPILHKYVKTILMIMVAASIDATVTVFRQTGIFLKKEQQ